MQFLKDFLAKNWKAYAVWLGITVCLYGLFRLGYLKEFNPPPAPIPVFEEFKAADGSYNFGWDRDDEQVQAVAATLRFAVFADTPAGQVQEIPAHFYQWDVYRKCDPRGPPAKNQNPVGSCVAFGTGNAIIRTLAGQIVLGNANEELLDVSEEVIYAGSRVEIGKGRIRGDGSVGAWAAQFVQQWGIVAKGKYGDVDLTRYDPTRCRAWGQTGVPDALEAVAREHPVRDITRITSWAEAKKALAQGYGIAICSSQGFSFQRDSRGVAAPSGTWQHCMCLDGYHAENGREYGHIENSWGPDVHKGSTGWGNPSTAGFWADAAIVDRMIKNGGDTWAFSGVKGFPARESEWFVQARPRQSPRLAALKESKWSASFLQSP